MEITEITDGALRSGKFQVDRDPRTGVLFGFIYHDRTYYRLDRFDRKRRIWSCHRLA